MRLHEIISESFQDSLLGAVRDLLSMARAKDMESVSMESFRASLAKNGYNVPVEQVKVAIEQSGFAGSVDDETITLDNIGADIDSDFDVDTELDTDLDDFGEPMGAPIDDPMGDPMGAPAQGMGGPGPETTLGPNEPQPMNFGGSPPPTIKKPAHDYALKSVKGKH